MTAKPLPSGAAVNLFSHVEANVSRLAGMLDVKRWRPFDLSHLTPIIEQKKRRALETGNIIDLLESLVVQSPLAARAQRQMDKHPDANHNGSAGLFELIDFNDAYVSTVLALPEDLLPTFNDELRYLIDRFCKRLRTPSFSNEQFEAITHGLSREIAVFRGAQAEGLTAVMTSRAQDAMGVDMIIGDPMTNRAINVDVKTRSSFHFRLKDLVREGRVSPEKAAHAEGVGYCSVVNGHGNEAVDVVLVRIDSEALGEIVDFTFENSHILGRQLRKIIGELGHTARVR